MKGHWLRSSLAILLMLAMVTTTFAVALAVGSNDADIAPVGDQTGEYATVELVDSPLATYDGGVTGLEATKPGKGERADPDSPAGRAYGQYLKARREEYKAYLTRNVPAAQIVKEYSLLYNGFSLKLNGAKLSALARGPNVRAVTYETVYRPAMSQSIGLIGAPELWGTLGGEANAVAGVMVGIIDTGIDQRHPFLNDPSLTMPSGFPKGVVAYTSNKVIVARVFCDPTFGRRFTPKDFNGHGTHVAGTVAGVHGSTATFKSVTIRGLSGVAPKAWLGNYNVFPSQSTGCFAGPGGGTPSHVIVDAVEAAYFDGMDVVNMSLGGEGKSSDQLMVVVDAASAAGMVVVVAAGNSGPGPATVESPGAARGALTAGASTNPHYVGLSIDVSASLMGIGAAVGEFNVPEEALEAPFAPVMGGGGPSADPTNSRGCNQIADDLTGKVALIRRGICTFTTKVRNAERAHAVGVVVINNVAGDPIAMAQDGTTPVPTIPAVMVNRADGNRMVDSYDADPANASLRVNAEFKEFITSNADILAGFSSRGPTFGHLLIKPDVTAPGVNVLSSSMCSDQPGEPCDHWEFLQGTSMSTPHVAGSAALLRQAHPEWTPEQIKSALVTTGKQPVWDSTTGARKTGVMESGGGRIDLGAASMVDTTIGPASHSFGYVPTNSPFVVSRTFKVMAGEGASLNLEVAFGAGTSGLRATVDRSSLTVGEGGMTTFTLSISGGVKTPQADFQGFVFLNGTEGDGDSIGLHVPFWIRTNSGLNVQNALLPLGALPLDEMVVALGSVAGVILALTGLPGRRITRREP